MSCVALSAVMQPELLRTLIELPAYIAGSVIVMYGCWKIAQLVVKDRREERDERGKESDKDRSERQAEREEQRKERNGEREDRRIERTGEREDRREDRRAIQDGFKSILTMIADNHSEVMHGQGDLRLHVEQSAAKARHGMRDDFGDLEVMVQAAIARDRHAPVPEARLHRKAEQDAETSTGDLPGSEEHR